MVECVRDFFSTGSLEIVSQPDNCWTVRHQAACRRGVSIVIGVIAKADETPEVEEFFELFKTPWELYRPGRSVRCGYYHCGRHSGSQTRDCLSFTAPTIKSSMQSIGIRRICAARTFSPEVIRRFYFPFTGDGLHIRRRSVPRHPVLQRTSVRQAYSVVSRIAPWCGLGMICFKRSSFLLSAGQPLEYAHIPTLDIHIRMLRNWILNAGNRPSGDSSRSRGPQLCRLPDPRH